MKDQETGTERTILAFENVSKQFPGVIALDNVSLRFKEGEVHAIVGENGAGKSTLIKVLSGAHEPTSGHLTIGDQRFDALTPSQARDLGVAVIYQEFTLVPVLTVAENIFLGDFPTKNGVIDRKAMYRKSKEVFERLGTPINPTALAQDLSTGFQQIVEIAKALARDAKIIVMDEPSAPLTTSEVEALFDVVDTLKAQGVTVIYISHRLDEIFRLTDRVSILRDGEYITTLETASTNKSELISMMVGRALTESYPERLTPPGPVALKVSNLTGNGVVDISFSARKGEILGFAGLVGAGRSELMEMLFGAAPIISGSITLDGEEIKPKNTLAAIDAGIALAPEDRKRHGVLVELAIFTNISLPSLRNLSNFTFIRKKKEKQLVEKYMDVLQVKAPSKAQRVKNLSGGNQQKVVLAKWLATHPDVLIFDEPTRGIDVGAKQEIYSLMNELAAKGHVILMVSSEMEELLGMSDRLVVLSQGQQTGTLDRRDFSQERVLELSSGEQ